MSEGQGGGSTAGPTRPEEPVDPYAFPPRPPAPPMRQPSYAAPTYAPPTYPPPTYGYGSPHGSPYPVSPWGAPPAPPPPQRGRALLVAIVGVCVLVVLAAALVGVARSHGTHRATTADSASLTAARRTILAELPRLQAFVAKDRGLSWKSSVNPEVLDDADFVAALDNGGNDGSHGSTDDPDDIGTTFAAMGLAKDADTFYADADSANSSDIIGFYDDATGRLVVRGATWTPSMEYTLVHELTHAIQDQSFDLSTLNASARTDDETSLTIRALIEGDAERVADDYYDQQPTSWQNQVDAAQGSGAESATPIVDVYGALPYAFGEDFVNGLYDKGGNAAVDEAFHAPPTTSAQLLHPQEWLAGTKPAPTPPTRPAAPPGEVADVGVMGQLGLWAAVDAADPHVRDTAKLDGWMGDSYVATDGSAGACFVDEVHFASAGQRTTAQPFLHSWTSAQHVAVTLEGTSNLRLSACKK